MGRAAACRAEGDTGALEELTFHWGSAYDIEVGGEEYTARRKDGKGPVLSDLSPEGLRMQISGDYAANPVPRDLP